MDEEEPAAPVRKPTKMAAPNQQQSEEMEDEEEPAVPAPVKLTKKPAQPVVAPKPA